MPIGLPSLAALAARRKCRFRRHGASARSRRDAPGCRAAPATLINEEAAGSDLRHLRHRIDVVRIPRIGVEPGRGGRGALFAGASFWRTGASWSAAGGMEGGPPSLAAGVPASLAPRRLLMLPGTTGAKSPSPAGAASPLLETPTPTWRPAVRPAALRRTAARRWPALADARRARRRDRAGRRPSRSRSPGRRIPRRRSPAQASGFRRGLVARLQWFRDGSRRSTRRSRAGPPRRRRPAWSRRSAPAAVEALHPAPAPPPRRCRARGARRLGGAASRRDLARSGEPPLGSRRAGRSRGMGIGGERGFEPTIPFGTPDFESGAFSRSASSPFPALHYRSRETVKPVFHPAGLRGQSLLLLRRRPPEGARHDWRRGWDSNPRYLSVYTLSKRAPSAARPPLHGS